MTIHYFVRVPIFVIFTIIAILFLTYANGEFNEATHPTCIKRDFGRSSFVCVCNSTYCDNLPPIQNPGKDEFVIITSSMYEKRFDSKTVSITSEKDININEENVKFEINTEKLYQKMIGWGTSFTDSATINLQKLSPDTQENLLKSYFTTSGLDYNMGRLNIGGCDFSIRGYTYADEEDSQLTNFALQDEDLYFKIPTIKKAEEMSGRRLKLVASPWTAPTWMKTNGELYGLGKLKQEMYQLWAEYIVKFLESYQNMGIEIWGMTPQNEPLDGLIPGFFFNCMGWTADEQRIWLKENLIPHVHEKGFGNVNILIHDDQRYNLHERATTILSEKEIYDNITGIAVHWYGDFSDPQILTNVHEMYQDKFILNTEACEGDRPLAEKVALGSWERLESYASDILEDVNHWVTGWIDWNFALDQQGGPNWRDNFVDSPIIIDEETDEFYKNPMYYAMGHFSKFVPEDSIKIDITSEDSKGLEFSAFKTPDSLLTLIVLNKSNQTMNASVNVDQQKSYTFEVEAKSLNSILFSI